MRRWIPSVLAAALWVSAATPAGAVSDRTVKWSAAKIFPSAVRFLRIDEGVTITEKDQEAGYVLFDLPDEGKLWHGALELIEIETEERTVVKLVLRLEGRPDYMEIGILDRLEKKLRDELGRPPEAKPKPEPKPEPEPEAPAE